MRGGLSEHYREIFEITRLSDFITILADVPETVAADHGGDRMTETVTPLVVRTPAPGVSVIEHRRRCDGCQ